MFQKKREKRMKNYNVKTDIKIAANKIRKTKNLSMPCIYAIHGNNEIPKFHTSDEKPEMLLQSKSTAIIKKEKP